MQQSSIVLSDDYRLKFMGNHILVSSPDGELWLIALESIKHGDVIPRETDKKLEWDI